MELGHYNFGGRNFFAIDVHGIDGNAAAVVDHGNRIVEVNGDFDLVSETGERFVDRVVHDFVHKMMQPKLARRANVHCRMLADGFHASEHFDRVGGIVAVAAINGSELPVFCFSFDDGSCDLFRGHSAPWRSRS